jgi:serine/threonine-protein kinase RsbW
MSAATSSLTLAIAPGPLVGPVLRRVVGILAARADMPVDRVDEVILLAEALAQAAARHVADDRLGVAVHDGGGSLRFEFGPLEPGTSDDALRSAGPDGGSGRAEVQSGDGGDYVVLTVAAGGA